MTAEANREVVERFWAAMTANDFQAAGDQLHDDFCLDWPQSGERIRGRANFIAINEQYPAAGRWLITLDRIVADEQSVATDVSVSDGEQADRAITFSAVRDNRIIAQTEYWLGGVEAAPWRAQWVEKLS